MATYKKSGVSNLDLHIQTGTYYGRIKLDGNTIRKAFSKNRRDSIAAKDKWLEELRGQPGRQPGSLGSLEEKYEKWIAEQKLLGDIKSDRTEEYKLSLFAAIRKTWKADPTDGTCPSYLDTIQINDFTKATVRSFKLAMVANYSATRVNGAITVFREVFNLAVADNMVSRAQRDELLEDLTFVTVDLDRKRQFSRLPCHVDLLRLKQEVEKRCRVRGDKGHWLFNFILLSGCRIDSARHVHWQDVDFDKGEVYFRKAKYGAYSIPLFPELREFLEQLKKEQGDKATPEARVLATNSLQSVLTSACKELKLPHLSAHDLRHLFATKAIEVGKDFAVVGAWLGHKDGGRTVMAIYGHLRKQHSYEEAANMKFLTQETKETK